MGQKINPISLRIAANTKNFDNTWYSDYFFTKLLTIDIYVLKYINSFFKLLKLPSTRLSICHLPEITKLYTFFCYPRYSRESKSRLFHISSSLPQQKKQKTLRKTTSTYSIKNNSNSILQTLTDKILWKNYFESVQTKYFPFVLDNFQNNFENFNQKGTLETSNIQIKKITQSLKQEKNLKPNWNSFSIVTYLNQNLLLNFFDKSVQSPSLVFKYLIENHSINQKLGNITTNQTNINLTVLSSYSIQLFKNLKKPKHSKIFSLQFDSLKYKNQLENYLSFFYNSNIRILPFKVDQDWQSANYFADEIVYFLERRISFRVLKNKLLKQFAQNSKIRGVRISCSGRVGGKSKKAQRARVELLKYGQTSLHIFSSKIDFAQRTAFTSLGSTGIKVWICYTSQ